MGQISIDGMARQLGMKVEAVEKVASSAGLASTLQNDVSTFEETELLRALCKAESQRAQRAEIETNLLQRGKSWRETFPTILGVAISASALLFAAYQLRHTDESLRSSNQFKIQSYVIDGLFGTETSSENISTESANRLLALDARFSVAHDFYESGSLERCNWAKLERDVCPATTNPKVRPYLIRTIGICDNSKADWEGKSSCK
jgi:hypothetical protein